MEFTVHLNDEDYLEYNMYHFMHSQAGKRQLVYVRFVGPAICALVFLWIWLFCEPLLVVIEGIALAVFAVIWEIQANKIVFRNLIRTIRKMKKDGKLPYAKETKVEFLEDEIIQKTDQQEHKYSYTVVEKICESEKAMYIYVNAVQAVIVPKNCFRDTEEKNQLLDFLREKCAGIVK